MTVGMTQAVNSKCMEFSTYENGMRAHVQQAAKSVQSTTFLLRGERLTALRDAMRHAVGTAVPTGWQRAGPSMHWDSCLNLLLRPAYKRLTAPHILIHVYRGIV